MRWYSYFCFILLCHFGPFSCELCIQWLLRKGTGVVPLWFLIFPQSFGVCMCYCLASQHKGGVESKKVDPTFLTAAGLSGCTYLLMRSCILTKMCSGQGGTCRTAFSASCRLAKKLVWLLGRLGTPPSHLQLCTVYFEHLLLKKQQQSIFVRLVHYELLLMVWASWLVY